MNLPKFIKDDERLFRLLLGDLFPSLELPVPEYGALQVSQGIFKSAQPQRVRLNSFIRGCMYCIDRGIRQEKY